MKRAILFFLLFFYGLILATAQDVITLSSGKELKAKIIHLNPKHVIFIPENNSDTVSLPRNEITTLHYKSGIIIHLSESGIALPDSIIPARGIDSLYALGERDAALYYKGYRGAFTGTLITSLYVPWGLIPAIACSSTPPAPDKLGFRDPKLMENPSYYAGYTEKAFKIKKKKVWAGFGIGTGATVGFTLFVVALTSVLFYK